MRQDERTAPPAENELWLEIDMARQGLFLRRDEQVLASYVISTAANGPGELNGTGCTPRGWHCVRARIGAERPQGAVFVGRRFTGEIYTPELGRENPQRDWILTRILWLSGLEPGFNRLGERDSMRRYIYIHGCPDEVELGQPGSKGCVRMRNSELVELFEQVPAGTRVWIHE